MNKTSIPKIDDPIDWHHHFCSGGIMVRSYSDSDKLSPDWLPNAQEHVIIDDKEYLVVKIVHNLNERYTEYTLHRSE